MHNLCIHYFSLIMEQVIYVALVPIFKSKKKIFSIFQKYKKTLFSNALQKSILYILISNKDRTSIIFYNLIKLSATQFSCFFKISFKAYVTSDPIISVSYVQDYKERMFNIRYFHDNQLWPLAKLGFQYFYHKEPITYLKLLILNIALISIRLQR